MPTTVQPFNTNTINKAKGATLKTMKAVVKPVINTRFKRK